MASNTITYKNAVSLRDCERFYLDSESADVYFVFGANGEACEKVPAHKRILSMSTVFESMFYGSTAVNGDICINHTTAEVFKEFLQFFYLATVRLTAKNYFDVMQLVERYEIDECVNDSSEICDLDITFENICWGYELAILFDHSDMQQFCEQFISKNPEQIFQSNSFLNCQAHTLRRILQLPALECDEVMVFDGCLAWARNACIQNGTNETDMQSLRYQLGDIFYEIRFGDMNIEAFYRRYCFYKGLFTFDEFEDIINLIALKDNYKPMIFHSSSRSTNNARNCRRESNEEVKRASISSTSSYKSVKISSF